MAVFRIDKTRDYTVMANHHLRNKALSLKAKGLLSLMLWTEHRTGCALCRPSLKTSITSRQRQRLRWESPFRRSRS